LNGLLHIWQIELRWRLRARLGFPRHHSFAVDNTGEAVVKTPTNCGGIIERNLDNYPCSQEGLVTVSAVAGFFMRTAVRSNAG
jgi:hypothetical protein